MNKDPWKTIKKIFPPSIITKIENNAKASNGYICGSQRVSTASRMLIDYKDIKNNLSLSDLNLWKSGITVNLKNGDYFTICEKKDKGEKLTEIDDYLLNNIGKDDNVSAIVTVMAENGSSSCVNYIPYLEKLKHKIDSDKWNPIKRTDNIPRGETYRTNKYWTGEYYYNLSGGSNTFSEKSHEWAGEKPPPTCQIFTDFEGSMDPQVEKDCRDHLTYCVLFSDGIYDGIKVNEGEDKISIVNNLRSELESILKERSYDDGNVLEWSQTFIKDDVLYCPLQCKSIKFTDFLIGDKSNDYLEISHNEAASKHIYKVDKKNNILLSDRRPLNIFWGTHLGNMGQQTMTIKEFHKSQREAVERQKELFP